MEASPKICLKTSTIAEPRISWLQKKNRPANKIRPKTSGFRAIIIIRGQKNQIRDNKTVVINSNAQSIRFTSSEEKDQGMKRLRVAYQGMPGAFSEAAALTVHPGCHVVPCKSFEDTIWAVESRRADRAILPVEGTLEGNVVRNYDLLLHHSLQIVHETRLFVNYCLLALPGGTITELRRVLSHPTALAHCSHGLRKLGLGHVTREAVEDTAAAAEMVAERRLGDTAAVASCRAAKIYGLEVVARGVQDEPWNVTRFLVLARGPTATAAADGLSKTSIVIAHEGGLEVLMRVLAVFSKHNISLTKLEVKPQGSAPLRVLDVENSGGMVREFEYVFYIDFEATMANPNAREAVQEVRGFATFVRVLGSYMSDPQIHSLD